MWSILAEAIDIHRLALRAIPEPMPPAVCERLAELRQQAYHLGIDLELETKWLPPADMTPEQASAELVKVNRSLENLGVSLSGYRRPPVGLARNYDEIRAYRDRLLDVVRSAA